MMPEQRRSRSIAMNADELNAFLDHERTARLATLGSGGPHVSPVWFIWDRTALWIYSLTRSQRWTDIARHPRVAVVIDAGKEYAELRGVEIEADAAVVGPVPRTGPEPASTGPASTGPASTEEGPPDLINAERLMAGKYWSGGDLTHDGRHAWLRVTPRKITSWDFRKLAALGRDR